MRKFDCLSSDCPILGPHLLEASAGTGKTFSIEHIFVRLLLEEVELEEILVVTFTRAATRELRNRIRANIEKAIHFLQNGSSPWNYLNVIENPSKKIRCLLDAQSIFDRAQIFTIHGFCYRMLKEFNFEANLGFSLTHPDQEKGIPKRLWRAATQFVKEQIGSDWVSLEQMGILLKEYDSFEELTEALFLKSTGTVCPFTESWNKYQSLILQRQDSIEEDKLIADFLSMAPQYKAVIKGDFEAQVRALVKSFKEPANPIHFRVLLREKGSLFKYLNPSNRKVKFVAPNFLHYPDFFSWAANTIAPLIQQGIEEKNIFATLKSFWQKIADPIRLEEGWLDPDKILEQMNQAISQKTFASRIQNKYKAVIVDEFQDTDSIQWDIFRTLFLESPKPLTAFYLVGDPKQSIYRFRNADVYTYFKARDFLGENSLYRLDTNFRSSGKLIGALNTLFSRNWLSLPKLQQNIPSPPVLTGLSLDLPFHDGKEAVHFMLADGVDSFFEQVFLPYTISEIEKLHSVVPSWNSYAILVKDRYQAQMALQLCQKYSIPAVAKSHIPLGKTFAFESLFELFKAIAFPKDLNLQRIVQSGPFSPFSLNGTKVLLEEKGLIPFFQICFSTIKTFADKEFERDLRQIIEALLLWESREGFSLEGLFRFLKEFKQLDSTEGGGRHLEVDENAVQILTLHISKGLEFEVVFALGVASQTPEGEDVDELNAEKLRQLYVAMTRAKLRLYVPISLSEKTVALGALSPIELFTQIVETQEGPLIAFLEKIKLRESVSFEKLETSIDLSRLDHRLEIVKYDSAPIFPQLDKNSEKFFFQPSLLLSFTSLAEEALFSHREDSVVSQEFTAHTIPKGKETGIFIHGIFEFLFSQAEPIWKDLKIIEAIVEQRIKNTPFLLWKTAIIEMIWKTLTQPLVKGAFSLVDLDGGKVQSEMEFLFASSPHFVKGFIDLVFCFGDKYYIVDWKTNWLGPDETCYASLNETMTQNDYWLQAALYTEALYRHVKQFDMRSFEEIFGGALYFFVRGASVCEFMPDLNLIERVYEV